MGLYRKWFVDYDTMPEAEMNYFADFINEFTFWDDGSQPDPTSSWSAPSAAYYMPQAEAQQQGLVWVNSYGHFGARFPSVGLRTMTEG